MGELVNLYRKTISVVAVCPNCGSQRWFIEMDDIEPESDKDFIDAITAVRCVDCDSTYIVEKQESEVSFESDLDLEGD